jgi:plasmid stabilization system protein ParE
MRVRWTPDAANDLEAISEHIAETNPEAALRIIRAIYRGVEMLGAPFLGGDAPEGNQALANWC